VPHLPKSLGRTQGVRPEVTAIPRRPVNQQSRPPVPYHGAYQHEDPIAYRGQSIKFMPSLSILNHQGPSVDRIWKQLQLPGEVEIDEFTRELVSDSASTPKG